MTRQMTGAKMVVQALKERGIMVVIVSAGVDLFVSSIAALLKVDDWIANGFNFDDDGLLLKNKNSDPAPQNLDFPPSKFGPAFLIWTLWIGGA